MGAVRAARKCLVSYAACIEPKIKPQNYEDSFYATEVERGVPTIELYYVRRSSSSKRGHKYCSFVNKWLKNGRKKTICEWKMKNTTSRKRSVAYKTLSSLQRGVHVLSLSRSPTLSLSLYAYFLGKHEWAMGPADRPVVPLAVRLLCLFYYGIIFRSLCHFSTTYFKRLRRDKWPLRVSRPRLIEQGAQATKTQRQELELFNNKTSECRV